MKVTLKVRDNLTIEVEAEEQKDAFAQIASANEVFRDRKCGLCGKTSTRLNYRLAQGKHKYYEIVCNSCGAQFGLGIHQEGGTLFPQYKDNDTGEKLPNHGWSKWEPNKE
jgi:hypothetical protein